MNKQSIFATLTCGQACSYLIVALLLIVAGLQTAWGQGFRVYKSDGTVAQFSFRTDSIVFYDDIGSDQDFGPYTPVNQYVVGTWYKSKTETITFNEEGTTNYAEGATYKFFPYQGYIVFYNASDVPVNYIKVLEATTEKLVVCSRDGISLKVWAKTPQPQFVEEIVLSETSVNLLPGEEKNLMVTVLGSDADNKNVTWKSSNEVVAEVNSSGKIKANTDGTCLITCHATDGSGVKAECQVTVVSAVQDFFVRGVYFQMIGVASGTFQMGNFSGESDERPVHEVRVSSFFIGQTEVTQELWEAVMGTNPSVFKGTHFPANMVSWDDCQMFVTRLNQLTGKTFRLPTEAEWEFAACGGNLSKGYSYSGSNTIDDVAWCDSNSGNTCHIVATKVPNELGIYDMSGNVWEWCQDKYNSSYYYVSPEDNPTGPTFGDCNVKRGGSWKNYDNSSCRIANRGYQLSSNEINDIGLRIALSL